MNSDDFSVCDVACIDVSTDAAAVYECYVSTEEVSVSICAEVTEVCVVFTNETVAVFVFDCENNFCCCNNLIEDCFECFIFSINNSFYCTVSCRKVFSFDEFCCDSAVSFDCEFTNVSDLCTC